MTKVEIIHNTQLVFDTLSKTCRELNTSAFFAKPDNKWSAARTSSTSHTFDQ
jgi:hypothetical protein